MNTPSVLAATSPKINFKFPAKDGSALAEWLEKAQNFRKHVAKSSGAMRSLEDKRAAVSAQIEELEARADELAAAEKIPVLRTQLAGLERKIQQDGAAEFGDATALLLGELTPITRRAIGAIINKEALRIAETLRPYFRSHHRAVSAVQSCDWIGFLNGTFCNDWARYRTLDGAIHAIESVLRNELPYPYDPSPSSEDVRGST